VLPFLIQAGLAILGQKSPEIPSVAFDNSLFGKGALLISCVAIVADASSDMIAVKADFSGLAKFGGTASFLIAIVGAAAFGAVTAYPTIFSEDKVAVFSMWFFVTSVFAGSCCKMGAAVRKKPRPDHTGTQLDKEETNPPSPRIGHPI
jgi:hypothetical protein